MTILAKKATIALGQWIVKNGQHLVYGGSMGLMGVLGDTILKMGESSFHGIMPHQRYEIAYVERD